MPIGPEKLKAFKAGGSPPMPMPPAPPVKAPEEGEGGGETEAVQRAAEEIENGETAPEVEQMLSDFDPESGSPPQAPDVELWNHCVELVEPDGAGAEKYAEPWMVVGQLYMHLGGEIDAGEAEEPGGPGHSEPDEDDLIDEA